MKQADVILLGYPLLLSMPTWLRKNDLDIYEPVTDPDGPAMTWGMFAIGHLELQVSFLSPCDQHWIRTICRPIDSPPR